MTVITQRIDPDWHESHLLIQCMNSSSVPRKDLFKCVREQQKEKDVLGERGTTHSDRAYVYWLKSLMKDQIAYESEGKPQLTALGKWIANSKTGTLEDRYLFISNLTCLDCRRDGYVVVLKAQQSTAVINSKGRLFMDTECPRCGQTENRTGVSDGLSLGEFAVFYDRSTSELRKTAKTMSQVILPR
jgi:hypothetical protein